MQFSTKLQANIIVDNTGNVICLPVIITREGLLKSYLKYLLSCRSKSQSWISRSIFVIRLLIDYVEANKKVFDNPKELFREFASCLYVGTIGDDFHDQSGLYWKSRKPEDANFLIGLATQFVDWLSIDNSDEELALNPYRVASPYEEKLNWAAYYQRKERAFLSHLWTNRDAKVSNSLVRTVDKKRTQSIVISSESSKAFPRNKINELLYNGFILRGKGNRTKLHERLDLRNVLITMLMHFGGLRISEVMHIYVEDISQIIEGGIQPVVKVYDPIDGRSPVDAKQTRKQYLQKNYGLIPRCNYSVSSKQFAGWKNPHLSNPRHRYFTVYFFPAYAGELFIDLWKLYLIYQRKRPPQNAQHPYAFTTRFGTPCSIKAYTESRKRAVERIGLTFSKDAGTTAHSDRHRYGQSLAENNVPPLIIKCAMHHCSLESQNTYTEPTDSELRNKLKDAENQALKVANIRVFWDGIEKR